jgi:AcrR family transcriptional regulator
MPKVNDDYLSQKRNLFLEAAYRVCMNKPMHTVSMREIITESGLSQGNIYRYFSNLDDILVELINQKSTIYDIKELVDTAVSSNCIPEKIISEIIWVWDKAILTNLLGVGKIYYEICSAYISDKERLTQFNSKLLFASDESYIWETMYNYIVRMIDEGYFKPKLPKEGILGFHQTSLDGITRDLILYNHYELKLPAGKLDRNSIIQCFIAAFILLLGGNERHLFGGNQ